MKTLSVVKHLAQLKSLLRIFVAAGVSPGCPATDIFVVAGVSPAECQATDTVATTETA